MIIIKRAQLQYYCNCLGELHEHGQRMLDSVLDLPVQLQWPYENLWTSDLSVCSYIAFFDKQPGVLLVAEYDDDYCQSQGFADNADARYVEIFGYASRLDRLSQKINKDAIVGICNDGTEIMLFIPTERVPIKDIPKLYYLMEQFGYNKAPDSVKWTKYELTKFICSLNLQKSIEQEMIDGLEPYMEVGNEPDCTLPKLEYMGLQISNDDLLTRKQLIKILRTSGANSGLEKVCAQYTEKFGNPLIWRYSFFDSAHNSGGIIPVQEGFLFLPYAEQYDSYDVNGIERLDGSTVETLKAEFKAYFDGLMAALNDISTELRACPVRYYADKEERIYYVKSGTDGMYKGYRRNIKLKQSSLKYEVELCELNYTRDFRKAQLDLDMYAQKHKLHQLTDAELQEKHIDLN